MGSISIGHWLIVLVIIMLIFGTGKLRNMGSDLGNAVKGFRDGVKGEDIKGEDIKGEDIKEVDIKAGSEQDRNAA